MGTAWAWRASDRALGEATRLAAGARGPGGRGPRPTRLAGGDGTRLDAIAFRAARTPLGEGLLAARGKAIHAAGRLKIDEWNGKIRVQLQLEDAAPAQV